MFTYKSALLSAVDCGDLQNLQNGQVYFTTTTTGSVAAYQCNPGYVLEGTQNRVCQETNGEWSGVAPICNGRFRSATDECIIVMF